MMEQSFLEEARQANIYRIFVHIIIEFKDKILLLEKAFLTTQADYELPCAEVLKSENLHQALIRGLMETARVSLKKIIRLLSYKDEIIQDKKERHFYFIAEAEDVQDILLQQHHSYAWVEPKEVFGYPIKNNLREILDLYIRLKQL